MIDEKKLIEELQKLADKELEQLHYSAELGENSIEYSHGNNCYLNAIEKVKSQPKIGEWIPCSMELPKPGQRYLVSAIWKDGDFEMRRVYDAVYGSDGNWHSHNYEIMKCKVIAWQPLPEAYHEPLD